MYSSETFQCNKCEHRWDDLIDRKERDEKQVCPECGEKEGTRALVAAAFMAPSRHRGRNEIAGDRNLAQMKEAAKMEVEAANSRPEQRKELKKQIKKLTTAPKKGQPT